MEEPAGDGVVEEVVAGGVDRDESLEEVAVSEEVMSVEVSVVETAAMDRPRSALALALGDVSASTVAGGA